MDSRCNSTQRGRLEKFQNSPRDRLWGPDLAQVANSKCPRKFMTIEHTKVSMIAVFLHIVDHLYPGTELWVQYLEEEIHLWEINLLPIRSNMTPLIKRNMRVWIWNQWLMKAALPWSNPILFKIITWAQQMRLQVPDPKQPTANNQNNCKDIRDRMPETNCTLIEFRPWLPTTSPCKDDWTRCRKN